MTASTGNPDLDGPGLLGPGKHGHVGTSIGDAKQRGGRALHLDQTAFALIVHGTHDAEIFALWLPA
jgi:hypothetical protein